MIGFIGLADSELKIQENLVKIRHKKCDSHNKYQASYFCTNSSCVKNSTSFLCELCYKKHSKNHLNYQKIQYVDEIFSTKRLARMKEDCKIDSAYEEKVSQVLQNIDQKFEKLKKTLCNIIDDECKKAKNHVNEIFSADKNNERIMKIVKDHEKVLLDLFTKNEIMNSFQLAMNPYLESFAKISEGFRTQIEIVENRDKKIELFSKNLANINEKNEDIVDFLRQKILNFDKLYNDSNDSNLIIQIRSDELDEITKLEENIWY